MIGVGKGYMRWLFPKVGDCVDELFVIYLPHLGINSKANSENPLKRVEDGFVSFLQPFMGFSYEPRNSFRGGQATK
jgi:hypothetical protein